ncbi:MAG: glycoside hydrolase TIM-barrel-like domain-containing protein [Rhodobacteraceae bacterium]|nr:glycoside hydrolase TIM-barrel-like domain-containing protein [Paracoccaceae bacterium]
MATLVLSMAGASLGAGLGGSVLGLSGAVIGRAAGAMIGRAIDQRILGGGSRAVETGRVDRLRLTGASEGAAVPRLWGKARLPGQVIWATRFEETVRRRGGGKGTMRPRVREYSYSISLALALCEGEIASIGRIWADGNELAPEDLNLRVYRGTETQDCDPKIEAVEGSGEAPAYRGTAYVVIEDLDLGPFGNRVPQFSFEVFRPAPAAPGEAGPLSATLRGVALIPGTGEYSLATREVLFDHGLGRVTAANVHTARGGADLLRSLDTLQAELPRCESVALVVSWFGDDLRCGQCSIRPKVEARDRDGAGMPWRAGGIGRAAAQEVAQADGRPVYGGTPADAAVIEAIRELRRRGLRVMFYPFVLMDQLAGNGRPDPWTGAADQPALPWRGRITTSIAPGRPGSPDGTAAAATEVAAFFGTAAPGNFAVSGGAVGYAGPDEWRFRRFVLHYARLCALAGGVDGFLIGSELPGLTRVRGPDGTFPAVTALAQLAADVRSVLGPGVRIGYAADWTEFTPWQDGAGALQFNLDPLWADPAIDFVGIDNYAPLSDWRDGWSHLDAGAGSIHDLGYLRANIEGGEGFDWYYASRDHRAAQIRTPITDGAHGEPWVWRTKDIRSWWSYAHHDRPGGVRSATPTAWVPKSKPIVFTEFGCPAVDRGTNEPNRFIDPKSSESAVPVHSDGRRDDLIQMQYLRAMLSYWQDEANNPGSPHYAGRMVDTGWMHAWAWDARPFPEFPGDTEVWSDGANHARGHWLNGRATGQPLSAVVAEICAAAGIGDADVSRLYGIVRGYVCDRVQSARAALQPLMLAYGFDAFVREGRLCFRMRGGAPQARLGPDDAVADADPTRAAIEIVRAPEAESPARMRLGYVEAEGAYAGRTADAADPARPSPVVEETEFPLVLFEHEARRAVERWMAEGRLARETARFALPLSAGGLGAGDVIVLDGPGGGRTFRIDRAELGDRLAIEATRCEASVHVPSDDVEARVLRADGRPAVPVHGLFLDLPLLTGEETPQAPYLAVAADPWPGEVAVYKSDQDAGYRLVDTITRPALVGVTETVLAPGSAGLWDRGPPLRVRFSGPPPAGCTLSQLLSGANLAAIGDGGAGGWEVFQFLRADPVAPTVADLSLRLRCQAGTDAEGAAGWPAGSTVVLLDDAVRQVELAPGEVGAERHFRFGPASRPYDADVYSHRIETFAGIGLRPYAPVHLRLVRAGTDLTLTWIRRTRIGGEAWTGTDVPLAEQRERYLVRVVAGGATRREAEVAVPVWTYGAAERAADGVAAPYALEVAQISDTWGPGPFARIAVDD